MKMKYKISKELFEAVKHQRNVVKVNNTNEWLIAIYKDGRTKEIFINDFFFECKEWALEQGYYIGAELGHHTEEGNTPDLWCGFANKNMYDGADYVVQFQISEQQTIFKLCQWILENKDK
jgi:hypothetical protein